MTDAKTFRGRRGAKVTVPTALLQRRFVVELADGATVGTHALDDSIVLALSRLVMPKAGWLSVVDWCLLPLNTSWTGASLQVIVLADRQDGKGVVHLFEGPVVPAGLGQEGGQVYIPNEVFLPKSTVIQVEVVVSAGPVGGGGATASAAVVVGFTEE